MGCGAPILIQTTSPGLTTWKVNNKQVGEMQAHFQLNFLRANEMKILLRGDVSGCPALSPSHLSIHSFEFWSKQGGSPPVASIGKSSPASPVFCCVTGVKWHLIVALISISLVISDIGLFFYRPLAIYRSFLGVTCLVLLLMF